jgi:hypothetical protein
MRFTPVPPFQGGRYLVTRSDSHSFMRTGRNLYPDADLLAAWLPNNADSILLTIHPGPLSEQIAGVRWHSNRSPPRLLPVSAHADADVVAGDCTKPETVPAPSQTVPANRPPSDQASLSGFRRNARCAHSSRGSPVQSSGVLC